MNKNTVLGWATFLMIGMGVALILLGAYRYNDVAGWGFATVGIGFFCIAWVFNALKGRVQVCIFGIKSNKIVFRLKQIGLIY